MLVNNHIGGTNVTNKEAKSRLDRKTEAFQMVKEMLQNVGMVTIACI